MRLRLECMQRMLDSEIKELKNGEMIVCDAYNLPSKKVITILGPNMNEKKRNIDFNIESVSHKNVIEPILVCEKIVKNMQKHNLDSKDIADLALCYINSLYFAVNHKFSSIAFPSISTGLFGFPLQVAKYIAFYAVKNALKQMQNIGIDVIFNVFSREDFYEYESMFEQM